VRCEGGGGQLGLFGHSMFMALPDAALVFPLAKRHPILTNRESLCLQGCPNGPTQSARLF